MVVGVINASGVTPVCVVPKAWPEQSESQLALLYPEPERLPRLGQNEV
jgi:hypothetical protein